MKSSHAYLNNPTNAANPNPKIIAPEMRFSQTRAGRLILCINHPVRLLKMSHQLDEPRKTPMTISPAEGYEFLTAARPKPANMAAKDRIVKGLVRVRRNVEA